MTAPDIVERLQRKTYTKWKSFGEYDAVADPDCQEAAAEIARLRARVALALSMVDVPEHKMQDEAYLRASCINAKTALSGAFDDLNSRQPALSDEGQGREIKVRRVERPPLDVSDLVAEEEAHAREVRRAALEEALAVIPGGDIFDPQEIADAIRALIPQEEKR